MRVGLAAAALGLGASVYVLDRPGGLLGVELASVQSLVGVRSVFGSFGGALPAGVFDPWDVALVTAGAALAYLLLTVFDQKREVAS